MVIHFTNIIIHVPRKTNKSPSELYGQWRHPTPTSLPHPGFSIKWPSLLVRASCKNRGSLILGKKRLIFEETLQRLMGMESLFATAPMVSTIFTLLAILGGVLGYLYGPYWGVRRVPGPPAIPLVGQLPLLAKYGPDVFSVLAKRYGPIFRSVWTF